MFKIAIDARELRTSTGRYMERLLHYLQHLDNDNEYLVLLRPEDFAHWHPINSNFKKIKCPYKEFSFGEQLGFARQLYKLKPDLVHFGMTQQPLLFFGKTITTVHDLTTIRFRNPAKNLIIFKIKQLIYRVVIWLVAHKSKLIITPSNWVKKDLTRYAHINPKKVVITYEAADKISEPAKAINSLKNRSFIIYVGRPQPHKNLKRLIEAFVLLKDSHPELNLILAGRQDKLYRKIESYVEKNHYNNVVFTGFVDEGQLKWLYENAKMYVFPSLSEGFGLPGLEAMAHGLAVASSSATCLPEVYGDAVEYFDPNNTKSISDAVLNVLDNPKLSEKLRELGFKQVKKYSWQETARNTHKAYLDILNK